MLSRRPFAPYCKKCSSDLTPQVLLVHSKTSKPPLSYTSRFTHRFTQSRLEIFCIKVLALLQNQWLFFTLIPLRRLRPGKGELIAICMAEQQPQKGVGEDVLTKTVYGILGTILVGGMCIRSERSLKHPLADGTSRGTESRRMEKTPERMAVVKG